MEKLDIPLEDLVLDLANPRLGEVQSQTDALKALVDFGLGYFRTLMTSVKEHGLDPGDAFYVLEDATDDKAYVVVDGNRRLAALRVLNEPSVLRNLGLSDADLRSLSAAAAGYAPGTITSVECVLFDDRAAADDWIERRHGKDLAGEGRLQWGPLEIERFQRDHSNLDVIGFVEKNTGAEPDKFAAIKKAVENNSSSLNRFLTNKAFRKLVGLTITTETDDSKVPYFTAPTETVLGVLEQIFGDIHEKRITSRSYNTADEIEAYLERLPDELKGKAGHSNPPVRFRDAEVKRALPAKAAEAAGRSTPADKTTRAKRPRLQLAERKHPFLQPATTKGQRLVLEASKLNARDFPLASAYTLRAFLEHTIDTYMAANDMPRAEGGKLIELNRRAELVIGHLIKSGGAKGQELRGARRVLTDTKGTSSIQALNDYHHDRYQIPASDALRAAWDACLPLFRSVYGEAS